jgi:tryptophanyl-tRNA synthetase
MKDIVVSGIQPTGELHIGNYLGALKNFVELQATHDCFFIVVDLHALTGDYKSAQELAQNTRNLIATYLAAGLDPEKSTIFVQSQVPAHSELAWIFNTITPIGELERMTQYKDKAGRQNANINVGLLDYPVLQAADILLYKPTHVPVGHDQIQHLELTNTIARKFNHKFGDTFKEVKPYIQKPLRIMSLSDPDRKMSKSEPGSFINMFDSPEEIYKKLAKAVTATDAPEGQMPQGVANLFELLTHFGAQADHDRLMKEYQGGSIKYSELKQVLADAIATYFREMRDKKSELDQNQNKISQVIANGAEKASAVAGKTLAEVKEKIGLI